MGHDQDEHGHPADMARVVDLRGMRCPMTFVRTRLALDGVASGARVLVLLDGAEPQARVPRTVAEQGHRVVSGALDGNGVMHLVVVKR